MTRPDRRFDPALGRGRRRVVLAALAALAAALLLAACAPFQTWEAELGAGGGADGGESVVSAAGEGQPVGAGGAAPADHGSQAGGTTGGAQDGAAAGQPGGAAGQHAPDGAPAPGGRQPNELSARTPSGAQTTAPAEADDPIGLTVPAIGVRSHLVRLGLNADRSMEVPDDFARAGWYVHAPKPGEVGPAVIAGHVDGRRGPAVFYRLSELAPGDEVHVHRADGVIVTFVVDRVEQHPKDEFPTEDVYGDTDGPELRLITCGGEFDRRARSHRDNIIVFARPAS